MNTSLHGEPARFATGLEEVAPGTFAWVQSNGGLGESNAGLVVGKDGSLLIDTLWDEALTRRMLASMSPATEDAPIRTVLNSHSDGDHWWGNREVPAEAEIVTSRRSAAAMRADIKPRELVLFREALKWGARIPGPLRSSLAGSHSEFSPFAFGDVRLRYPDRTFEGRLELDADGRRVEVIEVGPAHSAGDAVCHVPDARVVFAADILFVGVAPNMWHGPVENWLAALELLLELDAAVYVPGHGPVGNRDDVIRLRGYLGALRDHAVETHSQGVSAVDAAREFLPQSEGFAYPERAVVTIDAIHRAIEGRGPVGSRGPARAKLLRGVATLAGEAA